MLTAIAESQAGFRMDLRALARLLWTGMIEQGEYINRMYNSIDKYLSEAFYAGAKMVGILPHELTFEEHSVLLRMLTQQHQYIPNLSQTIWDNRRGVGKLTPLLRRLDLWVNAYTRFKNEAAALAGKDLKLEWRLWGLRKTKKPCVDCLKLNGRVYRASVWKKWNVIPQSPALFCHGVNCGCAFFPAHAAQRTTPGRPPKLSGQ